MRHAAQRWCVSSATLLKQAAAAAAAHLQDQAVSHSCCQQSEVEQLVAHIRQGLISSTLLQEHVQHVADNVRILKLCSCAIDMPLHINLASPGAEPGSASWELSVTANSNAVMPSLLLQPLSVCYCSLVTPYIRAATYCHTMSNVEGT